MYENNLDYAAAYIEGLESAQKSIKIVREFLRGSTYSTDRLINTILIMIQEEIDDLNNDDRQLCSKNE